LIAPLFMTAGVTVAGTVLQDDWDLYDGRDNWPALIDRLARAGGPMACENLAVCYWAGKPAEVDFFNLGQKLYKSPQMRDVFRRVVEERRYAYFVVDEDSITDPGSGNLPADALDLIRAHYALAGGIDGDITVLEAKRDRPPR
jgi:hypothetical protein